MDDKLLQELLDRMPEKQSHQQKEPGHFNRRKKPQRTSRRRVLVGTIGVILVCLLFLLPGAAALWYLGGFFTIQGVTGFWQWLSQATTTPWFVSWWGSTGLWQWAVPVTFTIGEVLGSPHARRFFAGEQPGVMVAAAALIVSLDLYTTYEGLDMLPFPESVIQQIVQHPAGHIGITAALTFGPEIIMIVAATALFRNGKKLLQWNL